MGGHIIYGVTVVLQLKSEAIVRLAQLSTVHALNTPNSCRGSLGLRFLRARFWLNAALRCCQLTD